MDALFLTVLAVVALAAAVYAQLQIPRFTASPAKITLTRAVLIVVGIASGYVASAGYANDRPLATLAFLIGFGTIHIPAAFILFIKRARHAGKS